MMYRGQLGGSGSDRRLKRPPVRVSRGTGHDEGEFQSDGLGKVEI